jgi:hypothetical protein
MSRHVRYKVEAYPQHLINRPMHERYLRSLHTHNYLNSTIPDMQRMYHQGGYQPTNFNFEARLVGCLCNKASGCLVGEL